MKRPTLWLAATATAMFVATLSIAWRFDSDIKAASTEAAIGQQLAVGQQIAHVGNSGNTGEPHLYIHAQRAGTGAEPLSGDPLPVRLDGRFLVRNDRISAP